MNKIWIKCCVCHFEDYKICVLIPVWCCLIGIIKKLFTVVYKEMLRWPRYSTFVNSFVIWPCYHQAMFFATYWEWRRDITWQVIMPCDSDYMYIQHTGASFYWQRLCELAVEFGYWSRFGKTITCLMKYSISPLRAKFFWGNINIYLHFMSFLHIDLTQLLKTLPQLREGPIYYIESIFWLPMSWWR